jgi:hypothetical protein
MRGPAPVLTPIDHPARLAVVTALLNELAHLGGSFLALLDTFGRTPIFEVDLPHLADDRQDVPFADHETRHVLVRDLDERDLAFAGPADDAPSRGHAAIPFRRL